MTNDELEQLLKYCPSLFHMAMRNSWPLIQQHGLLPTNRLLDLFEVGQPTRDELITKRRPASFPIEHPQIGSATIRDQIPLYDHHLEKCLRNNLTPKDWHARLNERVFFWLTEQRLQTLLCAGAYRKDEHIVLKVNAAALVQDHRDNIELAPMNTGCTMPFAHPRGADTFLSIDEYPYEIWRKKGRSPSKAVVELTVIGGVPNITDYVEEVTIRKCGENPVPI